MALDIFCKFSVILVSAGVTMATTSNKKSVQTPTDIQQYSLGITMLVLSLLCTAFLGMLQERTYKRYGPCWKEGVFYTAGIHLCGL